MTTSDENGRPDFDGFVAALRQEAEWVLQIHSADKTGQAASDARALRALADDVERVGRRLGHTALERTRAPAPLDVIVLGPTVAVAVAQLDKE